MGLIRTYLDSGVLIAAWRGNAEISARAAAILDNPGREFVSSVFVRLETLAKALYNKHDEEATFYQAFFDTVVAWQESADAILADA